MSKLRNDLYPNNQKFSSVDRAIALAREPAVCLFMLLRPKYLKGCSEAEKYAELKNQSPTVHNLVICEQIHPA